MRQPLEAGIRPYEDSDWPGICRVHDLARPHELAGSCDPRAFVPLADDPESAELPDYSLLVACDGDRVVGFAGNKGDYIGWLYVDPEHSGRGIGRKLLRLAVEQAGPTAWTICLNHNHRALRLYTSEGFRQVDQFDSDNAGYACTCLRLALQEAGEPGQAP
jgi:GNAT superfamily N-acetyltransferase